MSQQCVQGSTTSEHATTRVPVCLQHDYITVIGASHMTWGEWVRRQKGNKMRFINQGIRQLRQYPEATPTHSVQRIFLIFIDDYDRRLLDRVKAVVEGRYGARYRELDSIAHLLDFINQRIAKQRHIKQLDLYCHGLVGSLEFGYALSKVDSYRMRDVQANRLQPDAFEFDARIFSYACRTGLGIDRHEVVREDEDPLYEKSFAQVLANASQATVWAYPRKSNYDETYGTDSERASVEGARRRIDADRAAIERYALQMQEYRKRLEIYRQATGNENAQMPNEPEPTPPIVTATPEEKRLVRHADSRDRNEVSIDHPLDEEGAVRGVRAGDSPEGVPATLLEYTPK